jgi:hypothetical protein
MCQHLINLKLDDLDFINRLLQTYDSGITSMFEQQIIDAREVSIQYVGITKDILKLDYGPMQTPIMIFKCDWLK